MGDQDKEKDMENPVVVQKTRVGYADGSNRTMDWAVGLNGWAHPKRHELPKAQVAKGCELPKGVCNQRVRVAKGYEHQESRQVNGLSKPGPKAESGKEVRWAIEPDFMGRSNLYSIRMVLVEPRSREGSVSERLCNVWLDDARDELVIVYGTVKKLCIGSHVSK
ncbi:hypothetical protein DY000_02016106 [Brassica cretica]|uniref:Uncharacterized protein n=1 Tax=Brassica cretica TaxID=69181 RepID=A0ABQ7CQU8_BRACR|nr:hypothetical protein DY000_02016106 [Brassica cretica]